MSKMLMSFMQVLFLTTVVTVASIQKSTWSCSPLVYTWRLDFSRSCSPFDINITTGYGTGIDAAYCSLKKRVNMTDYLPISLTSYQIIELNQDLFPIKIAAESNINLRDTDKISFTSLTSSMPAVVSGGIQATVDAINAQGQIITLQWIVRYSNIFDVSPYSPGDSLGWMVLSTDVSKLLRMKLKIFIITNEFPGFCTSTSRDLL